MLMRFANSSLARLVFGKRGFSSEIFVSHLSFYTTEEELYDAFSGFGTIKNARLIRDPSTNRSRGFGFVNFESDVEAQKAIKAMDGRIFGGRLILVEIAKATPKA